MRKMSLRSSVKKLRGAVPANSRTSPWSIRVTPMEAMTSTIGRAPRSRSGR